MQRISERLLKLIKYSKIIDLATIPVSIVFGIATAVLITDNFLFISLIALGVSFFTRHFMCIFLLAVAQYAIYGEQVELLDQDMADLKKHHEEIFTKSDAVLDYLKHQDEERAQLMSDIGMESERLKREGQPLRERDGNRELDAGEVRMKVHAHSPTPMGMYKGAEIYEILDIMNPDGQIQRFIYAGTMEYNEDTIRGLPEDCIVIDPGLLYKRK